MFCSGLVPEPSVQREAHEAAERAGRAAARLLPQPEADEDVSGPAGARRAAPQRTLLLLWRYGSPPGEEKLLLEALDDSTAQCSMLTLHLVERKKDKY